VVSIVCVGEITVDRYLDSGRVYIGGISLNFAVNARRCGAERVALLSAVGDDAGGALARQKLARERVDHSHVITLPGPTARQDVRIVEGERFFPPGGYAAGVLADLRLGHNDLEFIAGFDVLVVPVFRQIEHLARAALATPGFQGRRVADLLDGTDLGERLEGLAALLPFLDIAFISSDEHTVALLETLARNSGTLIVATLGAAGSVAWHQGTRMFQPALPVAQPVDSTGCGDAFQAAFTVTYLHGASIAAALAAGAARAAEVLQHYGATDDA